MNNIFEATETTFADLISNGVVLVDYWAEWCGPCKTMGNVLHEIADDYKDKVKIVKVNVDANNDLAKHIRSIPLFEVYKDGNIVASKSGGLPKGLFVKWIDENI